MRKLLLTTVCLAGLAVGQVANATTIDFGVSWPAYTAPGSGNYAVAPYDLVLGIAAGQHANETEVAAVLNSIASTTFTATDINKTDHPAEIAPPDGYFTVPSGWEYLVVQYDGPNAGSVVIQLSGNDAKVPFDSSLIWAVGDKHAVSHFSVAGPVPSVPDGGTTAVMLGLGLTGLGFLARRKA